VGLLGWRGLLALMSQTPIRKVKKQCSTVHCSAIRSDAW
jgi:hypothetical protein